MNYKNLLKRTIDLHMHVGPEIIPRKFSVSGLIKSEKSKLKAIGIKSHFFPTIAMMTKDSQKFIIYSITLNKFVGGFNADIIRASSQLSPLPIIVWFPTVHALNTLSKQKYEIPSEWIAPNLKQGLINRASKNISGLTVFNSKKQLKKKSY